MKDKKKKEEIEEIEKLRKRVEELENNWKRALADYQNLEKRVSEEKQEFIKWANSNLILKLLPVWETFQKASRQLKDKGLDLAIKQLSQILKDEGLEKIEVSGKQFDPKEMECVDTVEGIPENQVAEELSAGYRLNDRILKVAQVRVYKRKIDQKAEELAKKEIGKGNYM